MRVCATSRRLASVVFSPAGHGTSTPTSITIATTTVGTVPSDTSWNTAGGVHHGTSNPFQGRVDLGQQAPVPVGRSSGLLGPSPGRTRPARSTPPAPPAPVDPRRTVPQTSGPRQRSDHQHKPVHQQAGDSSAPDLVLRQLLVEQPCPIAARRHQVVGAGTLRRTVPPSPFDVQPAEHRKPIEVARSVHRGAARARSSPLSRSSTACRQPMTKTCIHPRPERPRLPISSPTRALRTALLSAVGRRPWDGADHRRVASAQLCTLRSNCASGPVECGRTAPGLGLRSTFHVEPKSSAARTSSHQTGAR